MFPSFLILYVLIAIIVRIIKIVRESMADARRKRAQRPANYLRLLRRMRRNGYRMIYFGLSQEERAFVRVSRTLHRRTVVERAVSERLFNRYLAEMVRNEVGVNQLMYAPYHRERIMALLQAITYWHDYQLRALGAWRPGKCNSMDNLAWDLINHLFQQYEVPPALVSIWWRWQEPDMKFFCDTYTHAGYREGMNNALFDLYFATTRGASMRQYGALRFPISRRIASFYAKTPVNVRFDQAYWWCVYRAAGGEQKHAWGILQIPFCFSRRAFWNTFLRWVAQTEKSCQFPTGELLPKLVERVELACFGTGHLMEHKAYQPFAGIVKDLKLAGQTPWSLLRRIDHLVRPEFPKLPGLRNTYILRQEKDALVCLVRLKNGMELEEEGAIMGHCVGDGDYELDCLEGRISIWSLRREWRGKPTEHLLTVKLAGSYIEEIQGPGNGEATEEHYRLVRTWVDKQVKCLKQPT